MVTEKKGFSKREKIMLFVLIVVAILTVLIMYVIIPMFNHLQDRQERHGLLQTDKAWVDSILATAGNIRDGRNDAVARHELESARFLDEAHSSEVGRMLTQLCQRYGLLPVNLVMTDPLDFFVPQEDGATVDEDFKTVFLVSSATMTVGGTYGDLKNLLDAVDEIDYIRITSLAYIWEANTGDAAHPDRITIGFDVTMLKDDIDERRQLEEPIVDDIWDILDLENAR
ncbi:MAG: type II secretion system protein M [Oscillospiraceae bacterium]|nr:type II secretion system protein M [Oscillospiraceae bacterium]